MTTKVRSSVLENTAVTAGTYGGTSNNAVFTVDAQGRLTYSANATPSIANTQITGVITAGQIASTAVTAGTYGGTSNNAVFTVDSQGRLTYSANATPSIANTQITGTITIANGGTNSTATPTAGGAVYGTGTAQAYTAAGTSGQALISAGASAPAFGTLAIGTANINVSGTLTATNGGTGVATLSGVAYGNGTGAFTAATATQIVNAISTTAVTNATNATNATTSTTQAAGTNTTQIATTANVYASSIGWGQTWQVVTRTSGATYYNTTGKPISLFIQGNASPTQIGVYINGYQFGVNFNSSSGNQPLCSFIIPPNQSYRIDVSIGSIITSELR